MPATTACALQCLNRAVANLAKECAAQRDAASTLAPGALTMVDAGRKSPTRETSGCRSCKDGCAAGNQAATVSCGMASSPTGCLLCSGNAVAAHVACIEGCHKGGEGCP